MRPCDACYVFQDVDVGQYQFTSMFGPLAATHTPPTLAKGKQSSANVRSSATALATTMSCFCNETLSALTSPKDEQLAFSGYNLKPEGTAGCRLDKSNGPEDRSVCIQSSVQPFGRCFCLHRTLLGVLSMSYKTPGWYNILTDAQVSLCLGSIAHHGRPPPPPPVFITAKKCNCRGTEDQTQ